MNKLIQSLPSWLQVAGYFVLLVLATIIAGIVPVLNDFIFFFAIAFLLTLLFSEYNGYRMRSIGLYPISKRNWREFFAGTCIGGVMLLVTTVVTFVLSGDKVSFNRFDPVYLSVTIATCLWSAYAQEFVFRGFPFHALLSRYAGWKVQLVIMIPFGLMHVNGHMNMEAITITMLTTGLGSLLFGLAYIKTRNLSLPVGLHFGWNYLQQHLPRIADNNKLGLIKVTTDHAVYNNIMILLPYFIIVIAAILLLWFWQPAYIGETKQ